MYVPTGKYLLNMNRKSVSVQDRKSTRLNSSHQIISYAVFCLKKKTRSYQYDHAQFHRGRSRELRDALSTQESRLTESRNPVDWRRILDSSVWYFWGRTGAPGVPAGNHCRSSFLDFAVANGPGL